MVSAMSDQKCSCDQFERLEGARVPHIFLRSSSSSIVPIPRSRNIIAVVSVVGNGISADLTLTQRECDRL